MTISSPTTQTQPNLRILQQNCKHCINIAHTLINSLDPNDWDIVLLQEPYIYANTCLTVATRNWVTIYPTPSAGDSSTPRSIILVSDKLNPESYQQVSIPSNLITALRINVQNMSILIANIYNPPKTDLAINDLQHWLTCQHSVDSMIWAGDFNKHDTLWSGTNNPNSYTHSDAEDFIQLLATHDMSLCLPPGTPTYQSDAWQTWSTIDLIFISPELNEFIDLCDAKLNDCLPGADHLPLHTVLHIPTEASSPAPKRNFKDVCWPEFIKTVKTEVDNHKRPLINNREDLDHAVEQLTTILQTAIECHVPWSKRSPHIKCWWTRELTDLRADYAKASRREFSSRNTPEWDNAKKSK